MARPERFELPTYSSGGCRSIQLSYGRAVPVYIPRVGLRLRTGQAKKEGVALETPPLITERAKPTNQVPELIVRAYRRPRSRPPPPPLPARSALGRASLTLIVRPPSWLPLSPAMAFSPSSVLAISTNANPRERPVSRSVKMLTRSTCPYGSNARRSSSSVVLKLKLPTKMFFTVAFFLYANTGDVANKKKAA